MEENLPNESANNNSSFKARIDLSEIQQVTQQIKAKLNSIIIGQEQMIDLLLIAILSDGHVLIEACNGSCQNTYRQTNSA